MPYSYPAPSGTQASGSEYREVYEVLKEVRRDILLAKRAIKSLEKIMEDQGNQIMNYKNMLVTILRIVQSLAGDDPTVTALINIASTAASFSIMGSQLYPGLGGLIGGFIGFFYGAMEAVFGI